MKPGDTVIYTSPVKRWLLVEGGKSSYPSNLSLTISGIPVEKNDVLPVIQVHTNRANSYFLAQVLTPMGIGWISTQWLEVV